MFVTVTVLAAAVTPYVLTVKLDVVRFSKLTFAPSVLASDRFVKSVVLSALNTKSPVMAPIFNVSTVDILGCNGVAVVVAPLLMNNVSALPLPEISALGSNLVASTVIVSAPAPP